MIWSQFSKFNTIDYFIAALSTAVVSVAFAYTIYWFAPWGCDASAWLCLFPLSLIGVAPLGAICLPILFRLNLRRRRPIPDGWLPFISAVAAISQLGVTGYSLWLFDDRMRQIFFYEILIFPQGLAAGAMTGAVFWCSLYFLNNRRARLRRRG